MYSTYESRHPFIVHIQGMFDVNVTACSKYEAVEKVYTLYYKSQPDRTKYSAKKVKALVRQS